MRRDLAIVYTIIFIDVMSFGLLIPVVPFYAERLGAGGLGVGAIIGSFSVAQFVGAAVLGRLSDKIGRRPVLLIALAGTAATLIPLGLAQSLFWLIALRAANGLFAGSISTAQAYVADTTRPDRRAAAMGWVGASIGMGFVFGPAIGGWLAPYGFLVPSLVAAGISATALVVAAAILPESRRLAAVVEHDSEFDVPHLMETLRSPAILTLLAVGFLHMFAFTVLHGTYALLGLHLYGMNEQTMGSIMAAVGVTGVVVQGGLVGRLSARFGEKPVGIVGALLMGSALAAIPWAPTLMLSAAMMIALSFGNSLIIPMIATLTSRHTDPAHQGAVLGLSQATQALARGVGPVVLGAIYDVHPAWPYLIAFGVLVVVAGVLGTVPRPVAEGVRGVRSAA